MASLNAMRKSDSFRVVHDGTHGTGVNGCIRVRDQLAYPTAGDLRQAMRVLEKPMFLLTADVKRTHRLVKINQLEWRFQACRTSDDAPHVWLDTVGTFGISSAAVHWQRLFRGIQRAVYYLSGSHALFLLVYVDDLIFVIRGEALEVVAVAFLFMVAIGVPFSWRKCKGGTKAKWVGYTVDLEAGSVGISDKRANWICRWIEDTLAAGTVRMHDFASVLGRLNFAMAAIEHLRPFLGPLYAWSAAVGKLHVIAWPFPNLSHMCCATFPTCSRMCPAGPLRPAFRESFRADAQAEGEVICLGGWAVCDGPSTSECRWFSERGKMRPGHFCLGSLSEQSLP